MAILVTGGAGYIGSHTCVELLNNNHEIVVLDNLSNSHINSIKRIKQITGKDFNFYQGDLLNLTDLQNLFNNEDIDSVVHFAGLKAVGESVENPITYYNNNVVGTLNLCRVMTDFNVKKLVFSSSATVYGLADKVPIPETAPLSATNPYGQTKLMVEHILTDLYQSDPEWSIALLRYFNPIGAHESGLIGEDPSGIPNNLMPYITQVAIGKIPLLNIFGSDYNTTDGTGVRDYIHVIDLAKGHLSALKKITDEPGIAPYNLGTGQGYSVMELVNTFKEVTGVDIPYQFVDRRAGDVATSFADPTKASQELKWSTEKTLQDMCRDSWNWQQNNPQGYING